MIDHNDNEVVVGVDNGTSGALVAVSGYDGSLISKLKMPTVSRKISTVKTPIKEPDVGEIAEWIRSLNSPTRVFLEEAPIHAKSARSLRSQCICQGMLFGMLLGMASKDVEAHSVGVREWQNHMLGKGIPRGHTKRFALELAQSIDPAEDWLATPRSTTPHDGIVDAFLIAQFARIKLGLGLTR